MSAEALVQQFQSIPQQVSRFIVQARTYFARNNIGKNTMDQIVNNFKNYLSINKKLKIAKYRVAHLNYRLAQMERMMLEHNPNNFMHGKKVDTFR